MKRNPSPLKELVEKLEVEILSTEDSLLIGGSGISPLAGNNCKCDGDNCNCTLRPNNCTCGGSNNCACPIVQPDTSCQAT